MPDEAAHTETEVNQCPVKHGWLFLSGVCLGLLIAILYYQVVVL